MKTKSIFNCTVKKNTHQGMSVLIMALLYLFGANIAQAQDKIVLGSSVSTSISGSGVGLCLSPALVLELGRSSIIAGINFQNRNHTLTGMRGKYEFVINPEENCELFLFYDVAYHSGAYLDKRTVSYEIFTNPENASYYNTIKLKTIEQHIGFGLNIRVCEGLKFFGAAGTGFYNTIGTSKYEMNLFKCRELNSCSLMLLAGVQIDIKRIK